MKIIDVKAGDPVIFRRHEEGEIDTNIVHNIIYHSPTGFEWGYGGSGPAEFALNILYAFTKDYNFSFRHHQAFKWFFIAGAPKEGGSIKNTDIRKWIEDIHKEDQDGRNETQKPGNIVESDEYSEAGP